METEISGYAGEILFSELPMHAAKPAKIKNVFYAGEPIFALAYLPQNVKALFSNAGANEKSEVEICLNEVVKPMYEYQQPMDMYLVNTSMWVAGNAKAETCLVVDIAPDPDLTIIYKNPDITFREFGKKYDGPVALAETLGNLTPGEHTIKVEVKCNYETVACGKFVISGDNFSSYSELSKKLNDVASNKAIGETEFPKAVISDPEREKQMETAFKNSNDWKTGFIDGTEILKTAITYDWEIRRHEISGAILHRYCIAAIAVKTKSGGCAYRKVTFQEDYVGGKFQPLRYDGAGDKIMMDCANLK